MAGDQGVLAGAGAVHPVQLPGHAQPGLVEPGHLGGGDLIFDLGQEPVEPVGGAGGHGGHGAVGERGAEQFGQRLRGALLGQELPDIQVEHDRGDPRPVLHRRAHPLRRRGAGGGPAPTAAGDELVLGDPHRHRRKVEHLPALHPHLGSVHEVRPAARARTGLVPLPLVRVGDQRQRRPRMPGLPTRRPTALRRSEFGAGLVNGESDDGGLDELVESMPNRRFSSAFSASSAATRARSSSITRACSATRAASSSYDGRPSPACTP